MALPVNHPAHREQAKVMNRFDITKRMVARLHHDEAVIGGIGYTNFDLWAAGRRPQNFYMLGSMGLAVPIALGVALAQPQRRVFALEGDGSILMQLGSLATVASDPSCIRIEPSPSSAMTLRCGCARATPSPIGTARPMLPSM